MMQAIDGEYKINVPDPLLPGNGPASTTELGVLLRDVGMSTLEARAFIEKIQAMATHVALAAAPQLLEHVRKVQQARLQQLHRDLSLLPQYRILGVTVPYIQRDRVLEAVLHAQQVAPRV